MGIYYPPLPIDNFFFFHHPILVCLVSILNFHSNTVYMSQNEVQRTRCTVQRTWHHEVNLVVNAAYHVQRGILHRSTRLRRGKRGVFWLTRYCDTFTAPLRSSLSMTSLRGAHFILAYDLYITLLLSSFYVFHAE